MRISLKILKVPSTIGYDYRWPDLRPSPLNTYYQGYDPSVNPSLANEFSTAVLRFGHSSIHYLLSRYDSASNNLGSDINLNDNTFITDEAFK